MSSVWLPCSCSSSPRAIARDQIEHLSNTNEYYSVNQVNQRILQNNAIFANLLLEEALYSDELSTNIDCLSHNPSHFYQFPDFIVPEIAYEYS